MRLFRAVARADGHFHGSARAAIPDLVADLDQLAGAPAPFGLAARQQQVRLFLATGERARAQRLYDSSTAACRARREQGDDGCRLNEALAQAFAVPPARRRSPAFASLLSAALPGLGAVYTEHYVDAIYYFGLTAVPAAMAWEVRRPAAGASDLRVGREAGRSQGVARAERPAARRIGVRDVLFDEIERLRLTADTRTQDARVSIDHLRACSPAPIGTVRTIPVRSSPSDARRGPEAP